jgi:hypothetical protein
MDYYKNLTGDQIQAQTSNGKPECILTWVRKDDGKVRLYASRDLPGAGWGQRTTEHGSEVHWHLETTMRSVLIYDADTAAQAIAWVLERWAREDEAREQRETLERQRELAASTRQAIEPGMLVINPSDLTKGAGTSI